MRVPQVRSRWMWTALAVVVALAVAAVVIGGRSDDSGQPSPSASASASQEQRTLLIQTRNDDDLAVDNAVFAVDGGLPVTQLLVPSRLVVEPVGSAPQTLASTAGALNRSTSQDVLRDLFAARIDSTLSLGRLALAGMVDFVGGIDLEVDADITTVDAQTGQRVVVVAAGQQHLSGPQAAAYALAWLPGEPETARLARYSQVITGTIALLPDDQLRIEQMLSSLGGSARTTSARAEVASVLLALRPALAAGAPTTAVLPTVGPDDATASSSATATASAGASASTSAPASASGSGSAEPRLLLVRIRLPEANAVITDLLAGVLLDPEDARPRVLVRDGVGVAGLSTKARTELSSAGLVAIEGGATDPLGRTETRIDVGAGADATALGARIARTLGLQESAIHTDQKVVAGAEATVVLGSDVE